jgi:hypothetical protein
MKNIFLSLFILRKKFKKLKIIQISMAQNYVVAKVSITDESQNQLKTGDYKAILLTFNSPGLRQIGVTSSLGSFNGNYENQIFQIVFPNQGSAEVWGSPLGTQTKWKVVSKVDGNPITITIKDATGSNSVEEIQVLATNWDKLNLSNNPSQVVISINFVGPQLEVPGLVEIHNSNLVLSQEHTIQANKFSTIDPLVDMTKGGEGDKTLYVKKGSDGKNYLTFGGDRTRWNVYLNKDYKDAKDWNKIPIEYANVMYEVEWSPIDEKCKNLSFSFRTIHDPIDGDKEGFGKYGMHWMVGKPEVGIKVEYFHNEHGEGHDFKLPKPIELNKRVKVRMHIWSDPTGKREVTQKGEIQYEDDPTWHEVVNFTYKSSNWGSPPSGGSNLDRNEYESGPYMKPGIRMWCRSNGGGKFNIYNFKVYKKNN